jgi:chemotaxis signal transduction protein
MSTINPGHLPFVLFQVQDGLYAVSAGSVREILQMPKTTPVPNAPPGVRGTVNLRGNITPVIDLRVRLGLPSLQAELGALIQLLGEREQDHRNWLAELEACVRECQPFRLARDPHKCKFGLWYDQFKTKDRLLSMTLPALDEPHKLIHATADAALERAQKGDAEGALKLIQARRNRELAGLIKLFAESRQILTEHHREIAIVMSDADRRLAITADLVEAVEPLPEGNIEPMPVLLAGQGLPCRIGKRSRTNETILLLDPESFFSPTSAN